VSLQVYQITVTSWWLYNVVSLTMLHSDSSSVILNMGATFRFSAPFQPFASYVNAPGFDKIIDNIGRKNVGSCSVIIDCRVTMCSFDIY